MVQDQKKANLKEPDHSQFQYHPRDMDRWGAVRNCVCKECRGKRKTK